MKGLNKLVLVSAIAAISAGAQAELKVMDDASLSATTGQAGISIDLTANVSIGEIAYKDEGFIAIRDVTLGGAAPGTSLDNLTITVDVAGATDGAALASSYGFQGAAGFTEVTALTDLTTGGIEDGDLVIHIGATDGDVQNVDFGMGVKEVSLEKSTYNAGEKLVGDVTTNTVLLADLEISGRIGPVDVVIDESDSTLGVNAYFAIDAGTLAVPFLNVTVGGLTVNNSRTMGDNTAQNGNFAHAAVLVGTSAKGLMVDVKDFSADMDITNIAIGGASIGSLYITDLQVVATMDVYGH